MHYRDDVIRCAGDPGLAGRAGTAASAPHYSVTDLGTLGGTFSFGLGLNNKGSVAGFSTPPGDQSVHTFLWRKGVITDLGIFGGPKSIPAFAPLNERGEVGGGAETPTPDPNDEDPCFFGTHPICLPFVWQYGVMTALPMLGGNKEWRTRSIT